MSLEIGIVGLPNVGKGTLLDALTQAGAPVASYPFTTIDPNVGVVEVPDARLHEVAAIVQPVEVKATTICQGPRGALWHAPDESGAQAILELRTVRVNGDWDASHSFHQRCQHSWLSFRKAQFSLPKKHLGRDCAMVTQRKVTGNGYQNRT